MDLRNLKLTDLSSKEFNALRSYKAADESPNGESKCFELNRELRNGIYVEELSPYLKETADGLDTVFARCPLLNGPLTVFRGIGHRTSLPLDQAGKRFRSLEFWSTALSEDPLEPFLKLGAHGAILELRLPENFPAYNLETVEGAGGAEQELLLPRGILWRVGDTSVETVNAFLKHCKVESLWRTVLTPEDWPKSH
jgi:hypothetical protein